MVTVRFIPTLDTFSLSYNYLSGNHPSTPKETLCPVAHSWPISLPCIRSPLLLLLLRHIVVDRRIDVALRAGMEPKRGALHLAIKYTDCTHWFDFFWQTHTMIMCYCTFYDFFIGPTRRLELSNNKQMQPRCYSWTNLAASCQISLRWPSPRSGMNSFVAAAND